jgi:branched-chain amino acid transport system substrate-binding protein
MRKTLAWRFGALAVALALPASLATPVNANSTVKIGVIASTSGPLKAFGDAYMDGLEWGLNFLTKGKMSVRGQKIELVKRDDGANAETASTQFKQLVADGSKIIVGTTSSTVALTLSPLAAQNKVLYISGPAKIDLLTVPGSPYANKYTFRSGNMSLQDIAALKALSPIKNKKVVLFVEDNVFGQGNIDAAKKVLAPRGAKFEEIKVSVTATDMLPFASRAAAAKPDYVFVAWANTATSGLVFTALKQQGLFTNARIITGLANVAAYPLTGTLFEGSNPFLTNSYFPDVNQSRIATALSADYKKAGKQQDLFTPDGVNAAYMIVRALKDNASQDVDKMISNLEGYSFIGLKGRLTVRATDHVLVQPMYVVKMVKTGSTWGPQLVKTIRNVAP